MRSAAYTGHYNKYVTDSFGVLRRYFRNEQSIYLHNTITEKAETQSSEILSHKLYIKSKKKKLKDSCFAPVKEKKTEENIFLTLLLDLYCGQNDLVRNDTQYSIYQLLYPEKDNNIILQQIPSLVITYKLKSEM